MVLLIWAAFLVAAVLLFAGLANAFEAHIVFIRDQIAVANFGQAEGRRPRTSARCFSSSSR